jgi:hypothetical protein
MNPPYSQKNAMWLSFESDRKNRGGKLLGE